MPDAAGGRGRSCGPGGAAPSESAPALGRCAAGMFHLASSCRRSRIFGCSRRDAAFRLLLSCLAYPLVVGLGLGLHVVLEYTVQDHVVLLASVLIIGAFAAATRECGQRDGGGKLPVGVINLDNPHGSLGIRPLPCCTGGVQEFEFWSAAARWVVSKLKQGEITPLQDVISKHFDLRAGSGLDAKKAIDVGVRDGAKNGPGVEKVPKMARDVPVRCVRRGL